MAVLDLPSTHEEAWRWFDRDALSGAAAARPMGDTADVAALFAAGEGDRIVFVNGTFRPDQSRLVRATVEPLAIESDHPLGRGAGAGTGWALRLGAEAVADPVQIVYFGAGGTAHVPAEIALAEDAVATVVETYAGFTGWTNRLTRVSLARSARLQRMVRVQHAMGFVSLRDEATLDTGASLVSTTLATGSSSTRIDAQVEIAGEGGYAEVGGALLTRNAQGKEVAAAIRHAAPGGQSHQLWRAVALDQSTASLAARVEVARHAQKTDGEQSLRGLLLDRTATVNLKPELEIFADDVKCAHGATVGELDSRALFYMESRGIPRARAEAILTRAFVADALSRIGDDDIRAMFEEDADLWLAEAL